MNIWETLQSLINRLIPPKEENANQVPAEVRKLIHMVENSRETELSCEDVYLILDQYTELVHHKENTAELMPLVEHHIEICPDCREEFEALLRILEAAPV